MRSNKHRNKIFSLLILLLGLGIGYAALSTTLKINGTTNISGNTWNIYWDEDSIVVNPESMGNTTPTVSNDVETTNTKLNWTTNLALPGDFYEFTIDAVNAGTMDAMITAINKNFPSDDYNYISCSVTYADGTEPVVKDMLRNGKNAPTKIKYKIRVEFLDTITLEQLEAIPYEGLELEFSYGIVYGQADDTAYRGYYYGREVKYDPVSNSTCTSGETCYTWNVIDVDDFTLKEKITLQRNTSFSGIVNWISEADYNNSSAYGMYGRNDKGPVTALKKLETQTSSWNDALKVNYVYDTRTAVSNYGVLTCVNGVCDINGTQITSNLKARMITGEEIAALTVAAGAEENTPAYNWSLRSSNETDWFFFSRDEYKLGTNELLPSGQTSPKTLKWLVANTKSNSHSGATGSGNTSDGYWTLSPVSGDVTHAWSIGASNYEPYNGNLGAYYVNDYSSYSLRPVITVSKSVLNN